MQSYVTLLHDKDTHHDQDGALAVPTAPVREGEKSTKAGALLHDIHCFNTDVVWHVCFTLLKL